MILIALAIFCAFVCWLDMRACVKAAEAARRELDEIADPMTEVEIRAAFNAPETVGVDSVSAIRVKRRAVED